MSRGVVVTDREHRNKRLAVESLAGDIASGTATDSSGDGIITLNAMMGKVTTVADSAAADAGYTLTITNNKVSASDMAFVSLTSPSGTAANYSVRDVLCGDGTLTIEIQNSDADTAWTGGVFIVSFMVVKSITGMTENF